MRKSLIILIATVFAACGDAGRANVFTVEGTVKNTAVTTIYLEENMPGQPPTVVDSAAITNGKFRLKTAAPQESLYQLRLQGAPTPLALFINDNATVTVTVDAANKHQPYTVQGSPASQAIIDFDKQLAGFGNRLHTAGQAIDSLEKGAATDSLRSAVYLATKQTADSMKAATYAALSKASGPVQTLYLVSAYQNTAANLGLEGFTSTEMTNLLKAAITKYPNHSGLLEAQRSLTAPTPSQSAAPATTQAPDFSQPGVDGQPVSLSSFRGKWVLLDFWASWCAPCRAENPNVVRAYNQFKNRNFTVFGVSLDRDKAAWLKAIQQDGLTWTHASDLQFWNNAAAGLYGVQSIPANFLIDPQGNVVARDLQGETLTNKLQQLLR